MDDNKVTYRDILRESEYRKLIFSNVINRFGDSVDALALIWLVYQITQSAAWSALFFGLNWIPNVVVQPFAGAIVEKMNKKRVIVLTHLLRAFAISTFALMYALGMVNALVMVVTTLFITTVESFNLPADSAFTASTIRKKHLTTGMSLNSMLTSGATLVGTGIAGAIIALWGVVPAMVIDISTFFIAAFLIAIMKDKKDETTEEPQPAPSEKESFFTLFKDGIKYVGKTAVVRNFCFLCIAMNFMLVPFNALQAPIASEIFGMGSELLSFAGVFSSIGGIVGSALLPVASRRLSPFKISCIGIAAISASIAVISFGGVLKGNAIASYIAISACFFIMTIAASLMGSTIGVQFMKTVDRSYMARASAVFSASATAAMPAGSFLVSALLSRISTSNILLVSAIFSAVVLLITVVTKPELERKEGIPDAA
jgi:predicted MFS family arabinose efflux permease